MNVPVNFCLFDNVPLGDECTGSAAEDEGCMTFTDPEFVNSPVDLHLEWTSPAVDAGDDEIFDPDGSRSDMGAYGGTLANQFSMYDGYVPDYILMPGPGPYQWNDPDPEDEDLTFHEYYRVDGEIDIEGYHVVIQPGSKFEFIDGDLFMAVRLQIFLDRF